MLEILAEDPTDESTRRAQDAIRTGVSAVILRGDTPERAMDRLASGTSVISSAEDFTLQHPTPSTGYDANCMIWQS